MMISGSKLAALTGKSWRTIQRRLTAAGIEPQIRGKAHLFNSVAALQTIFEVDRDSGELDLSAERARLAKLQADRIDVDLRVRRGELLERDHALDEFGGLVSNARARLIQLPYQLRAVVPQTCGGAVEAATRRVIYEALAELAREGGVPDA